MPDRRDLNLAKYDIDADYYRELFYFCKRYQTREHEMQSLYQVSAAADYMRREGKKEDRTAEPGKRLEKLRWENELIEQAAIEVDSELYQYLIQNVTEGVPYESMEIPCGRRQFYEKRQCFFKLLSERR